MKNYSKGLIFALFAVLGLSTYTVMGKILLENLIPETLTCIAQVFSVIAILLFFGAFPELKKFRKLKKSQQFYLIIVSFLSSVIAPILVFKGLQNTTATNAVILGRTETVFVGIFSFLWLKEKITKNQLLGIVMMFLGVILIVTENFQNTISINPGDLLIIIGSISWALAACIFKKHLHHINPELVVLTQNGIGAVFLFIFIPMIYPIQHNFNSILNKEIIIPLLIFALFSIAFGQTMWYKALDRIPATVASSTSLLAPFLGVILAVIILEEIIFPYHLIGGVAILIGLILTIQHHKKTPHHHKLQKTKHWHH